MPSPPPDLCMLLNPAASTTPRSVLQIVSGTVWNEDKQAGIIVLSSPATSGTPSLNNVVMLKKSNILVWHDTVEHGLVFLQGFSCVLFLRSAATQAAGTAGCLVTNCQFHAGSS